MEGRHSTRHPFDEAMISQSKKLKMDCEKTKSISAYVKYAVITNLGSVIVTVDLYFKFKK